MSCPVPASDPSVINTPPAYVEYREDAALIAQLFESYFPNPPGEPQIMPQTSAALSGFSSVEREFRRLRNLEETDEFGPIRPSVESIEVARRILFQLVQAGLAVPSVTDAGTDHDGALRLAWENGPRFLELVVPPENHAAPYLYYSQGDQFDLQRDLAFSAVRERFNWLSA